MTLRRSDPRHIANIAVLLVALAAAASGVSGRGSPLSVLAGGAFMIANFHLIRMLVSRLIRPGASKRATMAMLAAKFFLVLLLVVGVMVQFPLEPMSFAVGATGLVLAAVLEGTLFGEPVGAMESEPGNDTDPRNADGD